MHRVVVLHGPLKGYHDGPIHVEANTVAEIIESVTRQLPGFKPDPVNGRKKIQVVGYETEESLYEDLNEVTEIHIVPQLSGAKSGSALTQILLGVALVGVGFALGPVSFLGSMAIKFGALMILGGLSQILAPQPETDKDSDTRTRYLGSPRNTVQIGTRIPILYGELRVGGHYLSFDINAQEFRGSAKQSTSGGK